MPETPTLRITVDVFSGRPNPVLELKGKEAADALKRLQPGRRLEKGATGLPPEPTLGYRGLHIEQIGKPSPGLPREFRLANGDLFGPKLAHRASDDAFEDFVCGSIGPRRPKPKKERGFPPLPPNFPDLLRKQVKRFGDIRLKWTTNPIIFPQPNPCACAPLYEPAWWNDPARRPHNNCYNYATNYRTDTFAQPGLAAGAMYTSLDCNSVRTGAIADDLINSPAADNKCPNEGHLVALVIWPGVDFHWYRKGRNGLWSHKPGGTAATNLDGSGNPIPDPRTANRNGYTDFCTFMTVMHGHIKIK